MRTTRLGCKVLEGHDVADLPLVSENAEILDAEILRVDNKKVDKVTGKVLSSNDYTNTEKTKLGGIAPGANNYTHPANHPASMITEATNKRFMTDAERTKLSGVETGAEKNTVTSVAGKTGAVSVTKGDVGLGSVSNYGVATKAEAEVGSSNDKYMTPLRVKEAMERSNNVPILETSMGDYGRATLALRGNSPNLPSLFVDTIGYEKFILKVTGVTPIVYIHCEWFTNPSRRILTMHEDGSIGSTMYSFDLNNTDKRIVELGSTMVITGSFVVSGTNTSISLPKIPKYVSIAYLDTAGASVKKGTIIEKFSSMGSYSFRHLEEADVGAAHTMLLDVVFDFKFTNSGFTVESSSAYTGRTASYIAIL